MRQIVPKGWLAAMPPAFRMEVLNRVEPWRAEAGKPLYLQGAEPHAVIKATQADIASVANVSVRAAATALARLEEQGFLVRGYGEVTIIDADRLAESIGSAVE